MLVVLVVTGATLYLAEHNAQVRYKQSLDVRDDLFRHTGAPLDDDAALVLVRAPAVWGNPAPQPAEATAP